MTTKEIIGMWMMATPAIVMFVVLYVHLARRLPWKELAIFTAWLACGISVSAAGLIVAMPS